MHVMSGTKRDLNQALALAEEIHWSQWRLESLRQDSLFAGFLACTVFLVGSCVAVAGAVFGNSFIIWTSPPLFFLSVVTAIHHWFRLRRITSRQKLEWWVKPNVLAIVELLRQRVVLNPIQQAAVDMRWQRLMAAKLTGKEPKHG